MQAHNNICSWDDIRFQAVAVAMDETVSAGMGTSFKQQVMITKLYRHCTRCGMVEEMDTSKKSPEWRIIFEGDNE